MKLEVRKLNLNDYETYHYEKERLQEACKLPSISPKNLLILLLFLASHLGTLTIEPDLELIHVRSQINNMVHGKRRLSRVGDETFRNVNDIRNSFNLSPDWCFVDCKSEKSELFF